MLVFSAPVIRLIPLILSLNLLVESDGKLIVAHVVVQLAVLSSLVQFSHLQHKIQQLL